MGSMEAKVNKLALGTVQFGTDYGIANKGGRVSVEDAAAILDLAWKNGVDTLDTAIAYGNSETVLGQIGVPGWKIVSKVPVFTGNESDVEHWIRTSIEGSLKRLGIDRLHAVLLHHSGELKKTYGRKMYEIMAELRDEGLIDKLGVSIYDPSELDDIYDSFNIDIIQAPLNIFDRRLISSGWLQKLHANKTEVHVRSVFLQGLLLMSPSEYSDYFKPWERKLEQWISWLANSHMTALEGCLALARSFSGISRIVVGVDNHNHLQQIIETFSKDVVLPPTDLSSNDIHLITPSFWPRK